MKVQPGAVSSKHLPQPLVQTGPHRSAHRDPDCPPQARPQRRHSHHSKPHECRSPRAPGSSTPGEGQRLKGGRKCRAILKTGRGGGMEEASCFRGQPISALRGGCARKWAPAILWEGAEEGQSEAVKKEVAEVLGGDRGGREPIWPGSLSPALSGGLCCWVGGRLYVVLDCGCFQGRSRPSAAVPPPGLRSLVRQRWGRGVLNQHLWGAGRGQRALLKIKACVALSGLWAALGRFPVALLQGFALALCS